MMSFIWSNVTVWIIHWLYICTKNIKYIAALVLVIIAGYFLSSLITTVALIAIAGYYNRSSKFVVSMFLLPIALFENYYNIYMSLLDKSYLLVASGLLVLVIRFLLVK